MGTLSKDGEKLLLREPMKARLEVDYWVKCVGLTLRHTLRCQARDFLGAQSQSGMESTSSAGLLALWSNTSMCTQMLIACAHVEWSSLLAAGKTPEELRRPTLMKMRMSSVAKLKASTDLSREKAKLFLTEYYLAIIDDAAMSLLPPDALAYSYDARSGILRLRALDKTYTYGYEYHAQSVAFSPLIRCNDSKVLVHLLRGVTQGFSTMTARGGRESPLLQQVGFLFGRFLLTAELGNGAKDLARCLMGAVISGVWLQISEDENLYGE